MGLRLALLLVVAAEAAPKYRTKYLRMKIKSFDGITLPADVVVPIGAPEQRFPAVVFSNSWFVAVRTRTTVALE